MPALIELEGITKIYQMGATEVRALDGVSLRIDEGEFVAIMGASGSGKSTLLSIIGLLDRPTAGSYHLTGDDVTGLSDDDLSEVRNRLAGFVFQQFYLLPKMTALENAELPLVYAGKREMRHRAEHALEAVGLGRRMEHYPNEMSGGEQQRVAISRAMVNDPLIIMADEPTGNLDTKSEQEIMAILENLNAEGRTIIMVTHEEEVARLAKRIVRMRDGKILSDVRKKKESPRKGGAVLLRPMTGGEKPSPVAGVELAEYLTQALRSIFSHKMRSFLSMLGILIGVAAVISMMAIGQGAKESVSQSLSSLGTNVLMVTPGGQRVHGVALQAGEITRFTLADAMAVSRLKYVKSVVPSVYNRGQVVYLNKNCNTQVQGTGIEYQYVKNARPVAGRFFDETDMKKRAQVALLGLTVYRQLFGGEDPVGKIIKINKRNYRVIGLLPAKGASPMKDQDDVVIIPITTAMFRLLGKDFIDIIEVEAEDSLKVGAVTEALYALLNKRHRIDPDDRETIRVRDMSEMREALLKTTQTISLLLGIVASISLFVGGIGIMNIMLVSVRERIKEIGLRKAIGARKRDIMIQFLIESVLMSLFGGVGGIIIGSLISLSIALITSWSVRIDVSAVLISTLFSSLVGLFFGLWPAIQASRLDPIVALRYE